MSNRTEAATLPGMHDTGFPYVARNDAKVLILGSMPSRSSLAATQYYAHPQNAFWPIMTVLFHLDPALQYQRRLALLKENHVALWDVAHQCIRPGSMDHAIRLESVAANGFPTFFATHPHICAILFNGRKAEEMFHKLVLPGLSEPHRQIAQYLLPSTSPANARMSRSEKLAAWRIISQTLEKG